MICLLLVCLIPFASAAVPDGFILDVSVDCSDGSSDATVTIKSDMSVKIKAHCATGSDDYSGEISGQTIQQDITVKYAAPAPGACHFKNPDSNSGLSFITIDLYYGRTIDGVQNQQETYTVSCLSKASDSANVNANTGFVRLNPEGIVNWASGLTFTGSISFILQDVMGQELSNKDIPVGKKVQLKATISGLVGTNAMTVSDCYAYGNDDNAVKYTFLSAGCGDGSLFAKNEGFTTSGDTVTSNYFPFFSLEANTGVQFTCNFTVCSSACDVNSCVDATRKKRSVENIDPSRLEDKSQSPKSSSLAVKDSSLPVVDMITVKSRPYFCLSTDDAMHANKVRGRIMKVEDSSELKLDTKYLTITVTVLGTLTLVTTLLTLYMCFKNEQSSRAANVQCEFVKP